MRYCSGITIIGITLLLAACATQEIRPISSISIYSQQTFSSTLTHVEDQRPAESRTSSGDGINVIYYGDDKITPLPVQVLDKTLSERMQSLLGNRKIVIDKYTVARLPVIPEYNPVNDIYGPSFVSAMLGGELTEPTDEARYECHIKGSVTGRSWWVKHSIPSKNGKQPDIEDLLRQCNDEAVTKITRLAR